MRKIGEETKCDEVFVSSSLDAVEVEGSLHDANIEMRNIREFLVLQAKRETVLEGHS